MKRIISALSALVLLSSTQVLAGEDEIGINMGAASIHNEDSIKLENFAIGLIYQFNELNDFEIKPRFDLDYINISDYSHGVKGLYKGSLNGVYEFASDNVISPYIVGGIGYEFVDGSINDTFETHTFAQGGGGLSYHQEDGYKFNLEAKVLQIINKDDQDNEVILTAGISIPLSKFKSAPEEVINECPKKIEAPDEDRDGVTDMLDQCPETPCYFTVDAYGCPIKATLRIHFDTNKADIRNYSMIKVERFATFLIRNKGTTVKVIGHTDSDADDAYNMILSQKRADSVVAKLVELGVSQNRLTSKGEGESMPVASNSTVSGKSLNRRIEVELTYPKK